MNSDQKLSPKYWVVHDKTTDEVFLDTANKSKLRSISSFLGQDLDYNDFLASDHLECILIEIKEVKL